MSSGEENVTQVKLVRDGADGKHETILWIESDGRLRRGLVMKLVGEEHWWTVDQVYSTTKRKFVHDDWKVGGKVKVYGR